jgi:predicted nucleic acid-binding protein
MSDNVFLDTNIWVYFFAKDPPEKAERISAVINTQMSYAIISTQVLGELYNVLTRKRIFSATESQAIISGLASRTVIVEIDTPKVLKAMEINIHYGYSYWDSLIIATALQTNCSILYSEDMQHDQLIEGTLRIVNPLI